MKYSLLWAPKAIEDAKRQVDFIKDRSPAGAKQVVDRLGAAVLQLQDRPVGRPGRMPGTYEKYIPKTSLIVAFEIMEGRTVLILRVVHTSRNWPEGEWPDA